MQVKIYKLQDFLVSIIHSFIKNKNILFVLHAMLYTGVYRPTPIGARSLLAENLNYAAAKKLYLTLLIFLHMTRTHFGHKKHLLPSYFEDW